MGDNAWYSTAFGDIKYGPDGISMEVGGRFMFAPYNTFADQLEGAFSGFNSFMNDIVLGATAGDFARNAGPGAAIGQTGAGFIPIYGQIADARDTAAAFGNFGNGGWRHWQSYANLAAVGVAWLPGFDWVKGERKVVQALDQVQIPHTPHIETPHTPHIETPHPLHPDSPIYPHPEGKTEFPGLDVDHRYSQTGFPERAHDPSNLDLKPAVENRGPKAAWEKELLQYEEDLMQRTGWTRDQVRRRVTQKEWKSIARTVHPTTHPNMDRISPK